MLQTKQRFQTTSNEICCYRIAPRLEVRICSDETKQIHTEQLTGAINYRDWGLSCQEPDTDSLEERRLVKHLGCQLSITSETMLSNKKNKTEFVLIIIICAKQGQFKELTKH